MTARKKPVKDGLWVDAFEIDNKPHLLGSRCSACGEVYFPRKLNMICTCCQSMDINDIILGDTGVVHTHTTVMMRPPGGYYKGRVPYTIGVVDLPEGVYVDTLFTEGDEDKIKIGAAVELVIEKLHDDEEDEILTYKFRPISLSGEK